MNRWQAMNDLLSVSALTNAIKKNLELHFSTVSVKGEISNLKEQTSGHYYFTLKDAEAQISAVLFRGNARELSRPLKQGDQVAIRGEVSVYPPRGAYQLIVRKLEYLGVGELLLQLHTLKARLEKQGWFDAKHKKPLPKFPKTIGVVTSATGSVIQDILNILTRRFSGFHLILNPVKVQGEGAAEEIAKAIEAFNQHSLADVLIVGRGGGSLEDLFAFNEERVASAIYHSHIPVISAVGHETDFSIADLVADVRAPTPSAAAEIATMETAHQLQFFTQSKQRMRATVLTLLEHHRKQLQHFKRHPHLLAPLTLLEPYLQRIDHLRSDVDLYIKHSLQEKQLHLFRFQKQIALLKPSQQIAALKQKLTVLSNAITVSVKQHISGWKKAFDSIALHKELDQGLYHQIKQKREKLQQLSAHLSSIDPRNLLTKGYCILFQENKDSVIVSTKDLKAQDKVRLQMHDGKVLLTVNEMQP